MANFSEEILHALTTEIEKVDTEHELPKSWNDFTETEAKTLVSSIKGRLNFPYLMGLALSYLPEGNVRNAAHSLLTEEELRTAIEEIKKLSQPVKKVASTPNSKKNKARSDATPSSNKKPRTPSSTPRSSNAPKTGSRPPKDKNFLYLGNHFLGTDFKAEDARVPAHKWLCAQKNGACIRLRSSGTGSSECFCLLNLKKEYCIPPVVTQVGEGHTLNSEQLDLAKEELVDTYIQEQVTAWKDSPEWNSGSKSAPCPETMYSKHEDFFNEALGKLDPIYKVAHSLGELICKELPDAEKKTTSEFLQRMLSACTLIMRDVKQNNSPDFLVRCGDKYHRFCFHGLMALCGWENKGLFLRVYQYFFTGYNRENPDFGGTFTPSSRMWTADARVLSVSSIS